MADMAFGDLKMPLRTQVFWARVLYSEVPEPTKLEYGSGYMALKTHKIQVYLSLSLLTLTYQNTLSLSFTPKHTNPKPSHHRR